MALGGNQATLYSQAPDGVAKENRGPVAGSCEHDNKTSSSVTGEKYLGQLSE
jgi:hypothetical protein